MRSKSQMRLMSSGHTAAVSRATSYFSDVSYYNEITPGIDYFQSVEQWVREFDSKKGEIIAGLKRVMGALFTRDNMTVSYTADDRGFSFLPEALKKLSQALPEGEKKTYAVKAPWDLPEPRALPPPQRSIMWPGAAALRAAAILIPECSVSLRWH